MLLNWRLKSTQKMSSIFNNASLSDITIDVNSLTTGLTKLQLKGMQNVQFDLSEISMAISFYYNNGCYYKIEIYFVGTFCLWHFDGNKTEQLIVKNIQ